MSAPAVEEPKPPKEKKESQASLIVRLIVNLGVDLFHDSEGTPYATTAAGDTYPIRSKLWTQWVQRAYYNDARAAASASTLNDALSLLAASACFSGPEREVFVRCAPLDGQVWLDLGNDRYVKVTADGWTVESKAPVRFLRPKGLLPLPTPVPTPANQIEPLLRDLINVTDADLPMVTAWLLGVLRARGPFPVLILVGEQGTAKSFGSQTLRTILDPNFSPLRSMPREPRDLMIAAKNSLIMGYDNLSAIPEWFSDDLCRLATGSGFATRELHTDTDEILFRAARPVLFNSIADVARRPDLLDRAMVVQLDPIPPEQRVTESTLNALFRRTHPALLGGLLHATSVALKHESTIKLAKMPRMADFATWVEAAAPALGWEPGTWVEAYDKKRQASSTDLMSADLVVEAVLTLPTPWEGQPTELFRVLTTQERQRSKDWPQTPQSMSARLRRMAPPLRDHGLVVTFPRTHKTRTVRIVREGAAQQVGLDEM